MEEDDLIITIYRRGFGNVVAEGSFAYQKIANPDAKNLLLTIKNVSIEMTDERPVKAFAFGLAVATRGTCHMRSRASIDVVRYPRDLLAKFYQGDVGKDYRDYTGKARMVWWHEIFNALVDSIGLCRFASIFSSINSIGYVDLSRVLKTATGLDLAEQDLITIGKRVYTLERSFLVREGITRADDYLPDLFYDVPVPDGPSKGEYIDRNEYENMLDEYYQARGWDSNGIVTEETKKRLDIP